MSVIVSYLLCFVSVCLFFFQLKFEGICGYGYTGDAAIDNVVLKECGGGGGGGGYGKELTTKSSTMTKPATMQSSTSQPKGPTSTEATQPTESGIEESATKPTMTQSTSSTYFLTELNSEATPPKNIVKDVPPEETTKNNTKMIVIVLVLLAILILITLIVFYIMYVRRRKFKKQVQSRVRCTYKKPSSPGQQSVEHGRHLESSAAEVTVHVTLSRTGAGLDTYETVEVQEGPTYANVKQTKSQTHREEPLTHKDRTANQTKSEDGYCMPLESSPLDTTNKLQAHEVENAEKQENKDHVYAVVHKDAKGRDSAASVHARTSCSKRLEPAIRPYSDVEPVNRSSPADPANHSDARPSSVEPANHSQGALVGDEKKDYLYAVVDKANKKKRPPQKPSPYRGLVYADLNHSTTSNTGPVKREFPTVYADIDYLKTDASSKLPEEHLDQPTE